MIREAKSVDEVRGILNYANWTKPDGNLRRQFLRAAKEKINALS